MSFKEKKEFEGLESIIHQKEQLCEQMKLALQTTPLSNQELSAKNLELSEIEFEIEKLYARWAELELLAK